MKQVLITGTSNGVGKAAAKRFLKEPDFFVYGIDNKPATIDDIRYCHYEIDVRDRDKLPELTSLNYIVNNAGIVTPQKDAIDVNLFGYINILEKYGMNNNLKSIVQIGSTASIKGYDNIRYCASQGGRDALTKWAANNYGNDKRHVIVNSLNLDGIVAADPEHGIEGTSLEPKLYAENGLMDSIADLSILKKLASVEEIAEWIYFLAVINTVMTGQILHIDGELMGCYKFIPYPGWND